MARPLRGGMVKAGPLRKETFFELFYCGFHLNIICLIMLISCHKKRLPRVNKRLYVEGGGKNF